MNPVVTEYQFDKNTHTDSHFLQDTLSTMEKSEEELSSPGYVHPYV